MPKKEKQPEAAAKVEDKQAEAPEDPPVVKELKVIDDKYLEVEKEYNRELNDLITKFTAQQKPLLEKRAEVLAKATDDNDPTTGTPGVKGFWLEALQNHPAMDGEIEEYDAPVLECLKDIRTDDLNEKDRRDGFRLTFIFAENPYFDNKELTKEYHTKEESPYTGETVVTEIKGCEIQWKAGKDVTFEMVQKKVKGGGAKKKKQAEKGASKEPRPSFFRSMFRDLKADGPLPDDIDPMEVAMACGADEDDLDDEDCMKMILDNDLEVGQAIRDNIIPFAVRWYTGEAAPERDDDDDEDEEEEEEDEESDDSDSPRRGGRRGKPAGKKPDAKKASPKSSPKLGTSGDPKEECKQQ